MHRHAIFFFNPYNLYMQYALNNTKFEAIRQIYLKEAEYYWRIYKIDIC